MRCQDGRYPSPDPEKVITYKHWSKAMMYMEIARPSTPSPGGAIGRKGQHVKERPRYGSATCCMARDRARRKADSSKTSAPVSSATSHPRNDRQLPVPHGAWPLDEFPCTKPHDLSAAARFLRAPSVRRSYTLHTNWRAGDLPVVCRTVPRTLRPIVGQRRAWQVARSEPTCARGTWP